LGQLVRFFMGAWDLCFTIQLNFESDGYPEDRVFGFFKGSSDFYPDFDRLLRRRIRAFLKARGASREEPEPTPIEPARQLPARRHR
jgi:hypothetical protein